MALSACALAPVMAHLETRSALPQPLKGTADPANLRTLRTRMQGERARTGKNPPLAMATPGKAQQAALEQSARPRQAQTSALPPASNSTKGRTHDSGNHP